MTFYKENMSTTRRLNIGEAELYRSVRLKSLQESPDAFSSRYEDAVTRSEESWRDQADSSALGSDRATFIIDDNGAVGLAALYRDADDTKVGELIQMWVAPEKRGGSAASCLIDEIFQWASDNNFSRVKAEVETSNSRAIRFYKKLGFTESDDQASHSSSSILLTKDVEQVGAGDAEEAV